MKRCSKCRKEKDESEFSMQRHRKDGLRYWCKECECEYSHKYYAQKRIRIGTHTRYKRRHRAVDGVKDKQGSEYGKPMKRYYRYEERHRVVDGVKEKLCGQCKKWKAESQFYNKRAHKDGLAIWCKECADIATNDCRRRRTAAKKRRP